MVGWHHRLNGYEFEQTPGVGNEQGSLVCCSPWGCKESDTTEQLKWTELKQKEAPGTMFYQQNVCTLAAYKNIKTMKLSLIEMSILNCHFKVSSSIILCNNNKPFLESWRDEMWILYDNQWQLVWWLDQEAAPSSVQSLSGVQLFVTPWIAARQASLSITISQSSLRLTSIESVRPSSHLILCRPLLLLPPIPPSIRVFSNESTLRMRWPKYWSFIFSITPSKEHPGLIFRMDWLDLLAVQGTLKSLLQHHSSKVNKICDCLKNHQGIWKSFEHISRFWLLHSKLC